MHEVSNFPHFIFSVNENSVSASSGYLKCTFSFWNFQCERTTRTIHTTKHHRIVHKDVIWDTPKQTNKSFYFTIFFLCYVFHIVEPVEFIVMLIHFKTFLALCSKFSMQNLGLEVKAHIQGLLSEFSAVIQLSFHCIWVKSSLCLSVCVSLQCFLCGGGLERVMVGAGLSVWGGRPGKGARPGVWSVRCGVSCVEEARRDSSRPVREGGECCTCPQTCWASVFRSSLTSTRCQRWGREYLFDVERERLKLLLQFSSPWREIPGKSCMYLKVTGQMSRTRRCKPQISVLLKSFLKKFQHSFSTITSDEWLAFRILKQ